MSSRNASRSPVPRRQTVLRSWGDGSACVLGDGFHEGMTYGMWNRHMDARRRLTINIPSRGILRFYVRLPYVTARAPLTWMASSKLSRTRQSHIHKA